MSCLARAMADACSFVVHCFSFHDVQHTHLHSYVPKHVLKRNKSTILSVTDVRSTIYTHAYSENVGFFVVMRSAIILIHLMLTTK